MGHGSITAVLHAKFQQDSLPKMDVKDQQRLAWLKFESKMDFHGLAISLTPPDAVGTQTEYSWHLSKKDFYLHLLKNGTEDRWLFIQWKE